jgi:hypothetical protein
LCTYFHLSAILIEKLEWKDDKQVFGKAKVLVGTPCGNIVKSLIENGNLKCGYSKISQDLFYMILENIHATFYL